MRKTILYKNVPSVSKILGAFDTMRQRLSEAEGSLYIEADRQEDIATELLRSSTSIKEEAKRAGNALGKLNDLVGEGV